MKSYLVCFCSDGGGTHDREVSFKRNPSYEDLEELKKTFEKQLGKKIAFTNIVNLRATSFTGKVSE